MTEHTWDWWKDALADKSKIGKELAVHENEPHIGYFRKRAGRGEIGWTPVAIVDQDGALIAVVGQWADGYRVPAEQEWTWCCRQPVSYRVYQDVAVKGGEWPDSIKTIMTDKPAAEGGDGREIGIGDNQPDGADDPLIELRDAIEDLIGRALAEADKAGKPSAATWGPEWKVKADRLANYTTLISNLGKRVDTAFETEKRPHLDAGRAVDNRWRTVKTRRDEAVKKIKALLTPFLQAQRDHDAEQRRKEDEAARLSSVPSLDTEAKPVALDPVKTKAGTMGRSVSLRKKTVARLTDPKAFASYVLGWSDPSHDVMDALQKVATKLVANGAHKMGEIPGVSVEDIEVAQ